MTRINAGKVARAYLIIVLLIAVLVSSVFQISLALALLVIQLYCAYRPPKASWNLILVVASLVLAPLALEGLAGGLFAVLLAVPALLFLDSALKQYALTQVFSFSKVGRKASDILKVLTVGLVAVFLVSAILWNLTLMFEVAILMSYLAVMLGDGYRRIPKIALQESKTWSRLVVGETESKQISLKGKTRSPIRVFLQSADRWVNVGPSNLILTNQTGADVSLRFTPPLAGPSKISVQTATVDSRGLLVTGQILEPVDLHIIPRAKYAQWLANKFLQQTSVGAGSATGVPRSLSKAARSGVEFHGSRTYQAGDRRKDIDWRHSYMLDELIVKEFAGAQGQIGIIVADLTAKDAEAADKLAYNLVMSALTLATEALPSALAVYNQKEVLAATAPMSPRETLKKALTLTQKIVIVETKDKVLQPAQIRNLKRSIGQFNQMETESAQKFSHVLTFELEANLAVARQHPGTQAIMKAVGLTQAPAVITVASAISYDSGAVLVTLEQLQEKGYNVVIIERNGASARKKCQLS